MVRLAKKYQGNNVSFASLNLDQSDDKLAIQRSNDFLQQMNADFAHYHLTENMLEAFAQLDLLGIPAVIFYDDRGQELLRLTGDDPTNQYNTGDVEKTILSLLQQNSIR